MVEAAVVLIIIIVCLFVYVFFCLLFCAAISFSLLASHYCQASTGDSLNVEVEVEAVVDPISLFVCFPVNFPFVYLATSFLALILFVLCSV